MVRPRVAVILGGRSSEHSISCLSARSVLRALDRDSYEVRALGIRRDGGWVEVPDDPEEWTGPDWLGSDPALPHVPSGASDAPTIPESLLVDVDVAFPVLHGPWGEDGTVQGLLETAGVPYVGSGVLASAAAMDKPVMKSLLRAAGLPVGPWCTVTDRDWAHSRARIRERIDSLGLPVFVKPARAGSSVGITKVARPEDLEAAIETARAWDPRVIVEAAIEPAREIECGVLTDANGAPRSSVCAEIAVRSGHEFYDFEAKYLDDSADLIVPAQVDEAVAAHVGDLSERAFEALGCEGLARVDFFVRPDGHVVINEVNTMPGFTPISMFPRMWAASGVAYPQLVDHLVVDALRRGVGLR